MASKNQIQPNRRNAQRSTGPKTPEGKDAVRLNANKHGLRSQEVLLPGEDAKALKELDENLRAELQPVGELENLLVDGIVAAHWRLRRLDTPFEVFYPIGSHYTTILLGLCASSMA